ncbi:hypothetical protein [Phytohabitans houttuyneae]|nr:hypothetical protein [Phytohabitans houttuyneae]
MTEVRVPVVTAVRWIPSAHLVGTTRPVIRDLGAGSGSMRTLAGCGS